MATSNISIDASPRPAVAVRLAWTLLILATLFVCYFSHLGAIGFVGPDEPRYAWIARDMAESGDWVTPRLYGQPWFEKPILYYWGAALSFKIFGVSEASARLPSALSALFATLSLAWLALRLYGAETARWLLLLLPTSVGMIGFSHAAATDMPFSAMLTIAMVFAAVVIGLVPPTQSAPTRQPFSFTSSPSFPSFLFGLFLGLAVLAKGPAAIILSGGAIFFWALFTKRWRDAFRLFHPAALLAFFLTALPWYILCARRNPDFFRIFIIEHNFKRYLTPEFQHIQPFWYYAVVLLVAFLPWIGIFLCSLVSGVVHLWRTRSVTDSTLFLICWAAFCALFFSISRSKLPGYILPAIPAIGLLMSRTCAAITRTRQNPFRAVQLATFFFFLVPFGLTRAIVMHMSLVNVNFAKAASIVFALMAVANLLLALFSSSQPQLTLRNLIAACAVIPILLAVSLTTYFLPSFFRWDPSGRSAARELLLRNIPLDQLSVDRMNRGVHYSLNFYLHMEIKELDENHLREGYVLSGSRACKQFASPFFSCEEVPFDHESTALFLYHFTSAASAPNIPSSRQLQ